MDTTSHICMGVATGMVISSVATRGGFDVDHSTIITMSIIANNMPDIDVLFKLKSNESYINNHRTKSHSISLFVVWLILLTVFGTIFSDENSKLIFIVCFIGLFSHIITDLFNGYGIQLFWPFSKKWIAMGITYTIDVLFIITHLVMFALMFFFKESVILIFACGYTFLLLYIFLSYLYHFELKRKLVKKYGRYKRLILQSKPTPFRWKYVYETTDKKFYIGTIKNNTINQLRYEKRKETINKSLEEKLKENNDLKAFLDFTPIFNYTIKEEKDSKIIKFYDLRYLSVKEDKQYYTFNCIVEVKNDSVINSYVGFSIKENSASKKFLKKINE